VLEPASSACACACDCACEFFTAHGKLLELVRVIGNILLLLNKKDLGAHEHFGNILLLCPDAPVNFLSHKLLLVKNFY